MALLLLTACLAAAHGWEVQWTGPEDTPIKVYPKQIASQAPPAPAPFRFASSQSSGMVLQMAPAAASVWGFAPASATVEVTFNGKAYPAKYSTWLNQSTWQVLLEPTEGGLTEYNITASSGGSDITLSGIVFGDVWVCSGQSNMAYPLGTASCWNASNINCTVKDAQCGFGCVQNAGQEIAAMSNYPHMRLYQNQNSGSNTPLPESQNSGWQVPGQGISGDFSAMCWFFGRDLYDSLANGGQMRPIGLIETNVGGTPDQHWSSPDAIEKCENLNKPWEWPAGYKDSVLWNGKVVPLLRNTIKGAIWMQGEANSRADGRQYNCSFQAMIEDWRAKWNQGTAGATSATFPFGWAQLNSNGQATPIPYPPKNNFPGFEDALGAWAPGFPSLRLAEDNARALPNTFQAVILDTPVASGSVHSPYKQPAGARLARGALSVAYNIGLPYPSVGNVSKTGTTITISVDSIGSGSLEVRGTNSGFQLLIDGMWKVTNISSTTGNTITLSDVPTTASAVRYLWFSAPCTNLYRFQCPIYISGLKPIGKLSGEMDSVPLGPFIAEL